MTAIGITASGTRRLPARGCASPSRGRRVLAALAALPAVVALSFASSAAAARSPSRDAGAPAGSFTTVTVVVGRVAVVDRRSRSRPRADPRDVVDAIVRLNALDGVTVSAGQRLAIPAEYAPRPDVRSSAPRTVARCGLYAWER